MIFNKKMGKKRNETEVCGRECGSPSLSNSSGTALWNHSTRSGTIWAVAESGTWPMVLSFVMGSNLRTDWSPERSPYLRVLASWLTVSHSSPKNGYWENSPDHMVVGVLIPKITSILNVCYYDSKLQTNIMRSSTEGEAVPPLYKLKMVTNIHTITVYMSHCLGAKGIKKSNFHYIKIVILYC